MPRIIVSSASDALRTIASFRVAAEFGRHIAPGALHARLEDLPVVYRRQLVDEAQVAHHPFQHVGGAGETPPLLRLIDVRSASKARWIIDQQVSSCASWRGAAAGDAPPAPSRAG
jgi:hypothetical protein